MRHIRAAKATVRNRGFDPTPMTEKYSLKYLMLAIASVLALTVALLAVFTGIYAAWIWFFGVSLSEFDGTLPYIYIAIIGIAVTVARPFDFR